MGLDRDEDGTWVGLREAAPLLGIASPEALRRRLRRGTFTGRQRRGNRGEWEVFVPGRLGGRVPPDVPPVQGMSPDAALAELRDRLARAEARLEAVEQERDRLAALIERLTAGRASSRPWPGLRAWWTELIHGRG